MSPPVGDARTTRIRLAVTCVLLTGLAFVQDPGLVVPDTKLDLVLDPARFLSRALHLWDPDSAFGQLQNQAYGYLWPMGPFFWLGDLLGVPDWAVQRAWWAVVLCTAFVGSALLLRALGVRSDLAVVVAALAYALSPRLLTVLGPISIEGWPSALAPWVLLPLVVGSRRGPPWRAAALSALAVAMVGGVNAAATFAVVPLGAVWLLTRERGRRRTALVLWWPLFTLLGTLWWLVPLFTLGAFSPPFLDFIETSAVTTFPTTVFDALRGTSNWIPYVTADSRAGNDLIVFGFLALMGAVLVAAGLVGILHPAQPHRWFLAVGLATGLVMVTAGHRGAVEGLFAGDLAAALDGALAPLRNVHKFDPVIRLPLVVGLAWTLDRIAARPAGGAPPTVTAEHVRRVTAAGVVVLCVGLAAAPAGLARVAPGGAFLDVPDYWRDAASWLADHDQGGSALLVPGSAFGDYVWGRPQDEPMQALARSAWAVRNQVPLTPPGNIRMLDRVEDSLAQGRGSPALTSTLRRAGVQWLVVRADLGPAADAPDPALVRQALADSPGVVPVRRFGPDVGGGAFLYDDEGSRVVVDGGRRSPLPAVEVWQVGPGVPAAGLTPDPVVVAGGPEDLGELEALGLLSGGAAVLASDVQDGDPGGGPWVLTDGLRDRERAFAQVHDGYSPVRAPGDQRRTTNRAADYLAPGQAAWRTTASWEGIASVGATSSASDASALGGAERGRSPYAALDADPDTQWTSDLGSTLTDRWRVGFGAPRDVGTVGLVGGSAADSRQLVRLRTPGWTSDPVALGPGQRAEVTVGGPAADRLEVERLGSGGGVTALAEVEVPGIEAVKRLTLPEPADDWRSPETVVLRADLDPRHGCVTVAGDPRCSAAQVHDSEEAAGSWRRFTLPQAVDYAPSLTVRPRPGDALSEELVGSQPVYPQASSTAVPDPRASALAAVDGLTGTTWTAAADDLQPALTLSWLAPQSLSSLRIVVDEAAAAARPTMLVLRAGDEVREVELDDLGRGEFEPLTAQVLTVQVTGSETTVDLDDDSPAGELPPGISEITLDGAADLPLTPSTQVLDRPCGSGPDVTVAGRALRTAVTASDAAILRGDSLPATFCDLADGDTLRLGPGPVDVDAPSGSTMQLDTLVLRQAGAAAPSAEAPAAVRAQGVSEVRLEAPEPGVVALRTNQNAGWSANGATPVVVDGWRQGWRVPAAGSYAARFEPDTAYRLGLAAGAVSAVVLVLVAALGPAVTRRRARPERPAVGAAGPPVSWGAVAAVGTGLLVAGWPGGGLAAVVAATSLAAWRRGAWAWVVATPATVLVAAAWYWWRPWGDLSGWGGESPWPAYLALVPVLAALVVACAGEKSRRRRLGRSTSR